MPDIERWRSHGMDRRQAKSLNHISREVQQGEAAVSGVNRVGQRAMVETMLTAMIRREAERIAPDSAELYAMIATATAMQTIAVINNVRERL